MFNFLNQRISFNNLNWVININPNFTKSFFVNAFFFFSLMPYVSPFPLGSDIQVLTGFVGYLIMLVLLLKDKFILDKRELLILGLGIFFIFYINLDEPTYQFRKAIGPIYGFGIYYVTKNYNKYFNIKVLTWVILIYLIAGMTQYFSSGLFNSTFENFIRMAKYTANSTRGLTSLTPEPSFLGTICIYILIIQDWFYKNISKDRYYYYRLFTCVLIILLSKSGGGYILLFLFIVYKSLGFFKRYWHLMILFTTLFFVVIANIDRDLGNKGLSDLVGILKSTSPKQLLGVSSLANRVNPILVGINGAFEKPLGRGSGSFTTQAKVVYLNNKLQEIYPQQIRDKLYAEISEDSVSTFGKYVFEYGIFFLLYLFLVLIGLNFKETGLFIVFVVMTGLLFSLPIVYPPIWLVFGLYDKKQLALISN